MYGYVSYGVTALAHTSQHIKISNKNKSPPNVSTEHTLTYTNIRKHAHNENGSGRERACSKTT